MTLQAICEQELFYLQTNSKSAVFVEDSDGDKFYLFLSEGNRVAIGSVDKDMVPVVYGGDVSWKVLARVESLSQFYYALHNFRIPSNPMRKAIEDNGEIG